MRGVCLLSNKRSEEKLGTSWLLMLKYDCVLKDGANLPKCIFGQVGLQDLGRTRLVPKLSLEGSLGQRTRVLLVDVSRNSWHSLTSPLSSRVSAHILQHEHAVLDEECAFEWFVRNSFSTFESIFYHHTSHDITSYIVSAPEEKLKNGRKGCICYLMALMSAI